MLLPVSDTLHIRHLPLSRKQQYSALCKLAPTLTLPDVNSFPPRETVQATNLFLFFLLPLRLPMDFAFKRTYKR